MSGTAEIAQLCELTKRWLHIGTELEIGGGSHDRADDDAAA